MKSVIAVAALAFTLFATGAKAQEPPAPALAKVVVYRTNLAGARDGVNVLHSEPKVFIDDVQVGKMPRASVKRGSVLEFSVAPGTHRIYSESKITAPVLGWLEDSVVRSDNRDFGVAESFSTCADIWIVW